MASSTPVRRRSAGSPHRLRSGLPLAALAVIAAAAVLYTVLGYPGAKVLLLLLVVLGAAEVVRTRRAFLAATERQAAQAERAREAEARGREADERLRAAHEVQDAIAHNLSLIDVQVGVALRLFESRPEATRAALAAIKQASKETLRELRRTRQVLRQDDDGGSPGPPPMAETAPIPFPRPDPAPGPASPPVGREHRPAHSGDEPPVPDAARLGELAAQASVAGLQVRTEVAGEPRPLPAEVDLAAFLIVQEALTNVARHARPASATVRVTYAEHELTVQVDDDGHSYVGGDPGRKGSIEPAGGGGIRRMREQAAALGGRLDAGPRPGGGFRVWARLPLDGPP